MDVGDGFVPVAGEGDGAIVDVYECRRFMHAYLVDFDVVSGQPILHRFDAFLAAATRRENDDAKILA